MDYNSKPRAIQARVDCRSNLNHLFLSLVPMPVVSVLSVFCSSPVRQKVSPPKPVRPPPPKYVPRKALPHVASLDSAIQIGTVGAKPKPPIRTRKKKFFTTDDVKPPRQSEFVELSTSDIVVDASSPSGEVRVLPIGATDVEWKEEDATTTSTTSTTTSIALLEVPEEREEVEEEGSDTDLRTERGEIDLDKDEWEVIPDSAAGGDSNKGITEEHCIQPNG